MSRDELLERLEDDLPDLRRANPGETFALDLYTGELVVVARLRPGDRAAADKFAARVTRHLWKHPINGVRGAEDLGGRVMKMWLVVELWMRAKRFAEQEWYRLEGREPGVLTKLKWWLT